MDLYLKKRQVRKIYNGKKRIKTITKGNEILWQVNDVKFVDWDDSIISYQEVLQNHSAKRPFDPIRDGYNFNGWNPPSFNDITSDIDITAQYIPAKLGNDGVPLEQTLIFQALEDNSIVEMISADASESANSTIDVNLVYSLDGETWEYFIPGETRITIDTNTCCYIKAGYAGNTTFYYGSENYNRFNLQNGRFKIFGRTSALIGNKISSNKNFNFENLFYNCSAIVDASQLEVFPNDWTGSNRRMFMNCTSLSAAPALPATTLTEWCYSYMFSGCSNLAQAPALPAKTLAERCYSGMFSSCSNLTQAPELPATILAKSCYDGMFLGCTSLTKAPELPATTLANACYFFMFSNCTSLTKAPELPATTLDGWCYSNMFSGCSNLTQAPALPVKTLAERCYGGMFSGTALIKAPELPATTLAKSCYANMFQNCSNLTQAPALPATTLVDSCYSQMFFTCHKLSSIDISFLAWDENEDTDKMATYAWLSAVANQGVLKCQSKLGTSDTIKRGPSYCPENWTVENISVQKPQIIDDNAVVFTALEDGTSIEITSQISGDAVNVRYPQLELRVGDWVWKTEHDYWTLSGIEGWTDDDWNKLEDDPDTDWELFDNKKNIVLSSGQSCAIKAIGTGNPAFWSPYDRWKFGFKLDTGKLTVSGNLSALIGSADIFTKKDGNLYPFGYLFSDCSAIVDASQLEVFPNKWEGSNYALFFNCVNLTAAPQLPSLILTDYCYSFLFSGCKVLTKCPKLPAQTLVKSSYSYMLSGCSNISEIEVGLTSWRDDGTLDWVAKVSPSGTFRCPSILGNNTSIERGPHRCPQDWNVEAYEDEKLDCLAFMALEDNSIVEMVLPKDNECQIELMYSDGNTWNDFIPGETSINLSYGEMCWIKAGESGNSRFGNANSENTSHFNLKSGKLRISGKLSALFGSALPSEDYAFSHLFKDCIAIYDVAELEVFPNDWKGSNSYLFEGCSTLSSFPKMPATKLTESCYEGMFSGCTSLKFGPVLLAEDLCASCYEGMFENCTSLFRLDTLSSKNLANNCYARMFKGCISLDGKPYELPAKDLKPSCYYEMFYNCSSIYDAPKLPATTLIDNCYNSMFKNCSKLASIEVGLVSWNSETNDTLDWMFGTSLSGTFTCPLILGTYETIDRGSSKCPVDWNVKNNTLAFTALEDRTIIEMAPPTDTAVLEKYPPEKFNLKYIVGNETTWRNFIPGTTTIELSNDQICQFKGEAWNTKFTVNSNGNTFDDPKFYYRFDLTTGKLKLSGNLQSIHPNASQNKDTKYLFQNCSAIVDISNLDLEHFPCEHMFENCTSLVNALTNLKNSYYNSYMFAGCTSLSTPPNLPITQLKTDCCYAYMFKDCTSLTSAPELPATSLTPSCYAGMFYGCTSLSTPPNLLAMTLATGCYSEMFKNCISLSSVPRLQAKTLTNGCYNSMFQNCKELLDAPELPAENLVNQCYCGMFAGCSRLSSVDISFNNWYDFATSAWLEGTSLSGKFKCPEILGSNESIDRSEHRCPSTWIVENFNIDTKDALCFTSLQDGTIIQMETPSESYMWLLPIDSIDLKYIVEGETSWKKFIPGTTSINLPNGKKCWIKAGDSGNEKFKIIHNGISYSSYRFNLETGKLKLSGKTSSLIGNAKIAKDSPFADIFGYCTAIVDASELQIFDSNDATVRDNYGNLKYHVTGMNEGMFTGCTQLSAAPKLTSIEIYDGFYHCMFAECTSLKKVQDSIPVRYFPAYSCNGMFRNCTALQKAPSIYPESKTDYGQYMCFFGMFSGCTALSSIEVGFEIFNNTDENYWTINWVENVAPTGVFKCPLNLGTDESIERGVDCCPNGWTVENID